MDVKNTEKLRIDLDLTNDTLEFLFNGYCSNCRTKLHYMLDGKINIKCFDNLVSVIFEINSIPRGFCSKCKRYYILEKQAKLLMELVNCKLIQKNRINNLSLILEREAARKYKTQMSDYAIVVQRVIAGRRLIHKDIDFINKVQVLKRREITQPEDSKSPKNNFISKLARNCWSCRYYNENHRCTLNVKEVNVAQGCDIFVRFIPVRIYRGGGVSPR